MKKKQMQKSLAVVVLTAVILGNLSGCGMSKSGGADTPMIDRTEAEEPAEEPNGDTNGGSDAEPGDGGQTDSYAESCYEKWEKDEDWWDAPNSEEYSKWQEKGFSSVLAEPLSTFAADVDTASYSNLRRLVSEGYTLTGIRNIEGAVRIEEMLNYFSYDYQEPKAGEPFGVNTRISKCPWNEEAYLLRIGLATEKIDYENAPPSNLVFLIDVSGSMGKKDKLPLLQEAFNMLTENLSKKDRVSVVTYSSTDEVVLRGVSGEKTGKIQKAINALKASGVTNGSKGIETAYEIAEEYFIEGGNNRIILATDGDLNFGLTTEEELEDLITEKKESGIFLSVLGFGSGNIKDNKMELLADKGNGNYSYIGSLADAKKVLVDEMTATLLTICKDVKLQVEFNPAVVSEYRLIGYHNRGLDRKDFHDDTKDGGEIGAGHSVTVLYELILKEPFNDMDEEEMGELKYGKNHPKELKASKTAQTEEWLTLSIRYKKPAGEESNLLQYPVDYTDYTADPEDDFLFAAAVAEFGLLASDSSYAGDASMKHVKKVLNGIDLDDEYKEEFLELVKDIEE